MIYRFRCWLADRVEMLEGRVRGGDMNQATFDHHSAAIISLCAGMTDEQLEQLLEEINDLIEEA